MAWLFAGGGWIPDLSLASGYVAPFVVLVLCGFGLPIPEEITMVGSGFLVHEGEAELLPMIGVLIVGTLIGDSIPFWIGRLYGQRALRNRAVRRALHPERLRAIERRFARQGARAVLFCRFVPGLRMPAWFTAGSLGMAYPRFLAIDGLGAAVMTPVFVLLGRASGETIEELEKTVENLHLILGFAALALAATLVGHLLITKRWPAAPRRGIAGGARGGARSAGASGAGTSTRGPGDED
ncbi:MAG: DedA family protein [Planctomycetota bacterium]